MPEGNHLVTVENVTVEELNDDEFRATVQGRDLADVESIELSGGQAHTFVDVLYTAQRASSTDEWNGLPANVADLYDAIVYLSHHVRAQNGDEAFQQELKEMEEADRWETEE